MVRRVPCVIVVLAAVIALLSGCAPHDIYRTETEPCTSSHPDQECPDYAIQRYIDPAEPHSTYTLGFVEFDDQGQLHSRDQMRAVLDTIYEAAGKNDLLLVVFVHGWKHSAAAEDENIETFRQTLRNLSALESKIYGEKSRAVMGVYLGWRGSSVTVPVIKELTFWDRKNTAHKVGHGSVTDILSRLEQVKKTRSFLSDEEGDTIPTRLVVIGHSFGGAIVYSAISQILMNRFVETADADRANQVADVEGFGDLVVLINPAFEALLFAPLSDMANERITYFPSQLPVMAILTSEADDATKRAFPVGRLFSTFFEKYRTTTRKNPVTGAEEIIDQKQANITAVGHFDPYKTHDLRATQAEAQRSDVEVFAQISGGWDQDAPGSEIPFDGSVLKRTPNSVGRNPYLVVRVDGELIKDHNTIDDERIVGFVTQLVQLAAQSEEPETRSLMRRQIMEPKLRRRQ